MAATCVEITCAAVDPSAVHPAQRRQQKHRDLAGESHRTSSRAEPVRPVNQPRLRHVCIHVPINEISCPLKEELKVAPCRSGPPRHLPTRSPCRNRFAPVRRGLASIWCFWIQTRGSLDDGNRLPRFNYNLNAIEHPHHPGFPLGNRLCLSEPHEIVAVRVGYGTLDKFCASNFVSQTGQTALQWQLLSPRRFPKKGTRP